MDKDQVKAVLPIIEAFANGIPIQYRDLSDTGLMTSEWVDINPDTTEFEVTEEFLNNPDEWRVKP